MSLQQTIPPAGTWRLSLVVPVYNEERILEPFLGRVVPHLERTAPAYEVICVNGGNADGTLDALLAARARNPNIKIIGLTRNFGKEQALTAGIIARAAMP